jgi:hypothetical protein
MGEISLRVALEVVVKVAYRIWIPPSASEIQAIGERYLPMRFQRCQVYG